VKSSTPIIIGKGYFNQSPCDGDHQGVFTVEGKEDRFGCSVCKLMWTHTYPGKTKSRVKALKILLAADQPMRPKAFAKKMWPDSPGWSSHAKCGPSGVSPGGGMAPAGGALLGRLCRAFPGIVYQRFATLRSPRPSGYLCDKARVRELLAEWGVDDG